MHYLVFYIKFALIWNRYINMANHKFGPISKK